MTVPKTSKPLVLHFDPVRFTHKEWNQLSEIAEVIHVGEYSREQFIQDLKGKYSNVVAIGRGYLTLQKTGRFDKELIAHFPPSLKYIAHEGAGYDQVDPQYLTEKNIQLSNCPNVVSSATADTNTFLMLGAMRNFEAGRRNMVAGKWPAGGFGAGAKEGIEPAKKVLGIIGMGGIGRAVRDRSQPFGFSKICYFNRSRLSPELEKDSVYVSTIEELVRVADVISINCPLNESTFHMINDELVRQMKDGVVIVNTARGAIIEETALIKHLKTGKVGAAGLDVFENEPHPRKELLELPNVMAIPHMGTHTVQTGFNLENWVIKNIRSGLETGKVISIVPEQKNVKFT